MVISPSPVRLAHGWSPAGETGRSRASPCLEHWMITVRLNPGAGVSFRPPRATPAGNRSSFPLSGIITPRMRFTRTTRWPRSGRTSHEPRMSSRSSEVICSKWWESGTTAGPLGCESTSERKITVARTRSRETAGFRTDLAPRESPLRPAGISRRFL